MTVRGEGCPSDLRRGPAGPGEDKFPSAGQKPFHISTPPTTRARSGNTPGSIPPRRMLNLQCHWRIADWLGLLDPPRGEDCVSGRRRGRAAPGEDNFPSPWQKPFNIPTTLTTRSRNRNTPGSIPPRRVWKSLSHWPIADWPRLLEPSARRVLRLGPTPRSRRTWSGLVPIHGPETLPYLYNSNNTGT